MADDRELAKGEAKVNAAPHAVGYLTLPLDAIKSVEPGVAYYAHLAFLRADGSEIVERAVELLPGRPGAEPARAVPVPGARAQREDGCGHGRVRLL
jgi:hypothetical protein